MTFAATLVLSASGAILAGVIGFLVLFYAPVAGTLIGKAVIYITRGKRGVPLAAVASLGAVLGVLLRLGFSWVSLTMVSAQPGYVPEAVLPNLLTQAAYLLVYLALVISALWWWIK